MPDFALQRRAGEAIPSDPIPPYQVQGDRPVAGLLEAKNGIAHHRVGPESALRGNCRPENL